MTKAILICVSLGVLLSACNTINGAGQDVKDAGEWTSSTAQKTQKAIEGQ